MNDRPTISISELKSLRDQYDKPTPLTTDEVHDYAVAALVVLRGMTRRDKLRVLARMRKVLG